MSLICVYLINMYIFKSYDLDYYLINECINIYVCEHYRLLTSYEENPFAMCITSDSLKLYNTKYRYKDDVSPSLKYYLLDIKQIVNLINKVNCLEGLYINKDYILSLLNVILYKDDV